MATKSGSHKRPHFQSRDLDPSPSGDAKRARTGGKSVESDQNQPGHERGEDHGTEPGGEGECGGQYGASVSESVIAQLASMPPVNEFVPGQFPQIKLNSTVTVYGKRGTGKSFFVRWMMDAYKDYYPWGWCFTKTKHNDQYQVFLSLSCVCKVCVGMTVKNLWVTRLARVLTCTLFFFLGSLLTLFFPFPDHDARPLHHQELLV